MYGTTAKILGFTRPAIRKVIFDENIEISDYFLRYSEKKHNRTVLINENKNESCEILKSSFSLQEGDIILIEPQGNITKIYDIESKKNSLFLTEECNCRCQTCPQPPVKKDLLPWAQLAKSIVKLIDNNPEWIGITGGEPTIKWIELTELLELIDSHLPKTAIQLLSNSRIFDNYEKAAALTQYSRKLIIGTPLFSDVDDIHDFATGRRGSFWETISGLHNLERAGIPIELRIVLSKLTINRLPHIAEFIYKNLPFVHHVAFMGFEPVGNGLKNFEKLWIDPLNYKENLFIAVKILHQRNMRSSLFNLQPCLVNRKLFPLLMNSISEWKIVYDRICEHCSMQNICGGCFISALPFLKNSIKVQL